MNHLDEARYQRLVVSAAAVRAVTPGGDGGAGRRLHGLTGRLAVVIGVLIAVTVLLEGASAPQAVVSADASADADLFSLTNQDRVSNGVPALSDNSTLGAIGEGARYTGCPGLTVYGRSVDMIQRNYFAHPILNCGQYVFSIMTAYGIRYQSAGENIGWNNQGSAAAAAAAINNAFMNSSEHRSNILNGAYNQLGIGSDNSGSAAWTGGGGSYTNVWMFTELFAQVASAPPPPPPPPPPPAPVVTAPRNSAAPVAPAQPPAATTAPAPAPTPTPTARPVPTDVPPAPGGSPPVLLVPPVLATRGGLIADSIEATLAAYLMG